MSSKWSKRLRIAIILLVAAIAVLLATALEIKDLRNFFEQNIYLGLIISFFIYIIFGIAFIPAEPVTILILAWQGPIIAIIMATLGTTVRGLIEFYFGENIGDLAEFEEKKEKLPFNLGKLPMSSPAFLMLARIIPGFGPKFVNIASGVFQIPKFTYIWTTTLANLIGASIVVLVGSGLITLFR